MSEQPSTEFEIDEEDRKAFVIIPHDLARDMTLSFECRGLLSYLLTHNQDKYTIRMPYIIKMMQGVTGKQKIYSILTEAINAGFILRKTVKIGNLSVIRYVVSSKPKFKKCFRRPENQDAGDQDPGKQDVLEEQPLSIDKGKNNKDISSYKVSPVEAPLPKKVAVRVDPSPAARELSEHLLKRIKYVNPDFSESTANWPKTFDQMLKNKSPDHLNSLIDWAFNDQFWYTVITSAGNFKKNLPKLEAKWNNPQSQKKSSNFTVKKETKSEWKKESEISRAPISAKDTLTPASRQLAKELGEKMLRESMNGGRKEKGFSSLLDRQEQAKPTSVPPCPNLP